MIAIIRVDLLVSNLNGFSSTFAIARSIQLVLAAGMIALNGHVDELGHGLASKLPPPFIGANEKQVFVWNT